MPPPGYNSAKDDNFEGNEKTEAVKIMIVKMEKKMDKDMSLIKLQNEVNGNIILNLPNKERKKKTGKRHIIYTK